MTKTSDYSYVSTLAACPRKAYYAYEMGWERREPNLPMAAGSALHEAFHVLYTDEWNYEKAYEALKASWGSTIAPLGGKHEYLTLGFLGTVLERYMEDREANPTMVEEGEVIGDIAEEALVFDWPHPETGEIISVGGKVDLPIRLSTGNFVVDHKCTTQWVNDFWALQFRMSHQLRIYAVMLQDLFAEPFVGAYINAVYIGKGAADEAEAWKRRKSAPNQLIQVTFTPAQLAETRTWLDTWAKAEDLFRACGEWPQNEKACTMYGGCEYLELCQQPNEKVRNARAKMLFRQKDFSGKLRSGADS